MIRKIFVVSVSLILLAACLPQPPSPVVTPTVTDTAAAPITPTTLPPSVPSPTSTTAPLPNPSDTPQPTQPQPPQGQAEYLAYVKDGQLLVTDVTNGVQGGTTQYTMAGENDQVMDLAWSPSGEFVAFVSTAKGEPHIFYIYALGDSTPTDLGPGSAFAWSPDSQSIAYVSGTYPNDSIWVTTIENPSPRQLTSEQNYAWGRPAFTPDGQALVVAGTDRNNIGATGNTSFTLETLALDGSGTRTPLPATQPYQGVRLPYDLQFSPDGSKLAFSTSYHLSACAAPGAYYVSNPDGSGQQTIISPSLKPSVDENKDQYHIAFSYDWFPDSKSIVAHGNVVDCNLNSPNTGKSIAGPQMSIIGLDGSERAIIPGFFFGISADRTGSMIAASHFQDGFQDPNPNVEIYSALTGQLILPLGPGSSPQFQP